jgi:hypothetical protein
MSKAIEALEDVMFGMYVSSRRESDFGPGQRVLMAKAETREKLSQLKSEELTNLRNDVCVFDSDEVRRRKEISEMLIKFDKEMLGIFT